jgi:hypothetical protein
MVSQQWQKGYLLSVCFAQFVTTITVLLYYNQKRPIFTYTTQIYDFGLSQALNSSNITLMIISPESQSSSFATNSFAVNTDSKISHNPYDIHYKTHESSAGPFYVNPFQVSTISLTRVDYFLLFSIPSTMCLLFVFMIVRSVDSGQMGVDSVYGEHGIRENIFCEVCFWIFVFVEHYTFFQVMASPANTSQIFLFSVTVTVILTLFCTAAVNSDQDGVSRRLEGIFVILLCVLYVFTIAQAKIVTSEQCTYLAWVFHIGLNGLLLVGHMWDNPVLCYTVMNCRSVYAILSCWFNVVLYIMV